MPATLPQDIAVPDLGDFKDVEVIDVLVKPGDEIELETPLITLETEKATMDVPSTAAGIVKSVAVKKGDRVSKGSVIASIEAAGGTAAVAGEQAAGEMTTGTAAAQPSEAAVSESAADRAPPAAPSARAARAPSAAPAESANREPSGAVAAGHEAAAAAPAEPAARGPLAAVPSVPAAGREAPAAAPREAAAVLPPIDEAGFARAHASPSVRKFARELGVDLVQVKGTGARGRITAEDVKGWVKQTLSATPGGAPGTAGAQAAGGALPQVPQVDFSKFGEIETRPLGRIQKISGPRLQASWLNVPHVWQMDEADITAMEEARGRLKEQAAKQGIKLTPLAFILRACVKALQEFPIVNSSLDAANQSLILKKYVHLGFAADTPGGLVVPVIRDADRKDVYELARELASLSEKARAGKLSAAEMQGASFTVSSLGGIGGTAFTPIVNAPEVAILGVARSSMKPVYRDGQFVPRLMLPFTFAYDHRVVDGAAGVRFTTFLAHKLADVKGLLEAVP